jgi:pilus assembly protein CpaB
MFVSPDAIPSVASETVPKGDVAISVSVDQVHGVAGLIQPGDKVDILVDIGGDQETYLYQSVPVMAVGTTLVPVAGKRSTAGQTSADAQPSNIITFAVPPAAATRIALANSGGGGVTGGIYLALAAPGNGPTSTTPVTGSNLIDGASTGAPTPAGGSSPSASGLATGERIQGSEKNDTTP